MRKPKRPNSEVIQQWYIEECLKASQQAMYETLNEVREYLQTDPKKLKPTDREELRMKVTVVIARADGIPM